MPNVKWLLIVFIVLCFPASASADVGIRPTSLQQAAAIAIADMVPFAIIDSETTPPVVCVAAAVDINRADVNADHLGPDRWKAWMASRSSTERKNIVKGAIASMGPTDLEPATLAMVKRLVRGTAIIEQMSSCRRQGSFTTDASGVAASVVTYTDIDIYLAVDYLLSEGHLPELEPRPSLDLNRKIPDWPWEWLRTEAYMSVGSGRMSRDGEGDIYSSNGAHDGYDYDFIEHEGGVHIWHRHQQLKIE